MQKDEYKRIKVATDGGCRDNPGPGAWAFTLSVDDAEVIGYSGYLPHTTNNQAEYRALEAACLTLSRLPYVGCVTVEIESDSQLVVNQINGVNRVNDPIRPYFDTAFAAFNVVRDRSKGVCIRWVPREENKAADTLCNQVMDRRGIVCSKKGRSRSEE